MVNFLKYIHILDFNLLIHTPKPALIFNEICSLKFNASNEFTTYLKGLVSELGLYLKSYNLISFAHFVSLSLISNFIPNIKIFKKYSREPSLKNVVW